MNILTCLIQHRDSNAGNFLLGRTGPGPRVFSIDNGVAFASKDSDRGMLWKDLRVKRLPGDAVARLRGIRREDLEARLGVLAQWRMRDGHYVPVAPSGNLAPARGVRHRGDDLQMGLTEAEIADVFRQAQHLLARVDAGEIETF
jgi:hypothetical protein